MASNLRSVIFWLSDFLKGNKISKNFNEVKSINESNEKLILKYQSEKLNELLLYALKNVPYYKKTKYEKLDDFPVLNKMDFKNNLESFCSNEFSPNSLDRVVTSGSTGTPFVSFRSKNKGIRNTADTLYFARLAGYQLGEKLFYLKIWSKNNRKSRLQQYVQNIRAIDVMKLSPQSIENFIHELNCNDKIIHLNSYASALEEICKYLDRSNDVVLNPSANVGSIIAQSEALMENTEERIIKYFRCKPYSRYSNVENGIIAQQTKSSKSRFMVNCASYKIEVLKMDEDIPADKGELGRLVVTDLFNFAMPFIRYDTGDIARFLVLDTGKTSLKYLDEIHGRRLDILLNTKGEIVSSFIMYSNMFQYPEIDQYQLIQEGEKEYSFNISMKGVLQNEEMLRNEFISILGNDAKFTVNYVDEIPLLSSGKRRKIVNNYIKSSKNR